MGKSSIFSIQKDLPLSMDRTSGGRLFFVALFFMLAYALMMGRVFDLTVLRAHEDGLSGQSSKNSIAKRGEIYDRNGALLATSLKLASLSADPGMILEPELVARQLHGIFPDLSVETLEKRLKGARQFVWVKRSLSPAQQYAVLELGQPGLKFSYEPRRVYPKGALGSHVLGYGNIDGQGLAGIERSYDDLLIKGEDVHLTLDIRLQHALRKELRRAVSDFSAKAAAGIIMDVTSGEVLAAVSLPDFDPHKPVEASSAGQFNRLSLGVYELGSLFKIFSTAALLEHTKTALGDQFDARNPIKKAGFTIRDFHAQKRFLNVPEVFMFSSNIGSALMGEKIGTQNLRRFYDDLGLLTPLETDIKEIGHPLVPEPWRDIHTLTASFGHGIATTPLQLIAGVSSIVNGGLVVNPHFVKREEKRPEPALRIISEKASLEMRQLLRLVVTDGTGAKADVPGYLVGGKTGTAEKAGANGYDKDKLISSFAGVFPMDRPRYAILIMIDEPHGTPRTQGFATGGWVAAPAVANVIRSMASILGLPPVKNQAQDKNLSAPLRRYIALKQEDKALASYE